MFETLLLVFFTLFVLGIAGAIVAYGLWFRKKLSSSLNDFSAKFGFRVEVPGNPVFGYPSAEGTFRDHPVRVFTVQNKSFDMHDLFTIVEMETEPEINLRFSVHERSPVFRFGDLLKSLPEILTGDGYFDSLMTVHGTDKEKILRLLDEDMKKNLLEGSGKYPYFNLSLEDYRMSARRQGTMISREVRESAEYMLPLMDTILRKLKTVPSAN